MLSIRGRYREVRPGLGVKETTVREGERRVRYLLCRDEARAAHDARVRREVLATLEGELSRPRRGEGHRRKDCQLLSKPGYARYLKEGKGGSALHRLGQGPGRGTSGRQIRAGDQRV